MNELYVNLEGFWYSEYEPWFPVPEERMDDMPRKSLFLDLMVEAEEECRSQWETIYYRGFSTCRICGRHNGSMEYHFKRWHWPSGYRHYIEEHNVRPSLGFQMMIMGARFEYPTKTRQELKLERAISELGKSEDEVWKQAAIKQLPESK